MLLIYFCVCSAPRCAARTQTHHTPHNYYQRGADKFCAAQRRTRCKRVQQGREISRFSFMPEKAAQK
jgi:hypothetical protein